MKRRVFAKSRNRLLIRLALFVSLVTFISVFVAGLIAFSYLHKEMTLDIQEYNQQRINHLGKIIDETILAPALGAVADLGVSQEGKTVLNPVLDSSDMINNFRLTEIQKALQNRMLVHPGLFSDIIAYYETASVLVSSRMGVRYLHDVGLPISFDRQWIEFIRQPSSIGNIKWLPNRLTPNTDINHLPISRECISLVFSLKVSQESIRICFNIPADQVYRLMKQTFSESSSVIWIQDQDEHIIVRRNAGSNFELTNFMNMQFQSEAIIHDDILMLSSHSQYLNWTYNVAIPLATANIRTQKLRMTVLFVCIMIFVIISILSIIYLARLARPFGKMLSFAYNQFEASSTRPAPRNEIAFVADSYSALLELNKEQARIMVSNRSIVLYGALVRLLLERLGTEDALSICNQAGLDFPYSDFIVFIFQGTGVQHPIGSNSRQAFVEQLQTECETISKEHLNTHNVSLVCYAIPNYENYYSIIVNHKSLPIVQVINGCINRIDRFCHENSLSTKWASGSNYKTVRGINKSYEEALHTFEYFACLPNEHWLDHSDALIWDQNHMPDELLTELPIRFSRSLQKGRLDHAIQCVDQFQEAVEKGPYEIRGCIQLAEQIAKRLDTHLEQTQNEFTELSQKIDEIFDIHEFLNQIRQYLLRLLSTQLAPIQSIDPSTELASKAEQYIQLNFRRDLSVQEIADHVGISRFHLFRIFKEQYKATIVDYIAMLRMNEARTMIQNTDKSIQDIATEVGFSSLAYFSRKFKSTFGYAPSQLRNE